MCGRYALGIAIEDMPKRFNESVLNPDSYNSSESNANLSESDLNNYNTTTNVNGSTRTVHIFVNALNYHVSYNIPPTSGGVIIYLKESDQYDYNYVVEPLKFGMLPVWAKPHDPLPVKRGNGFGPKYSREVQLNQAKHFNCRKETLAQPKSMWASAKKTRCVVPAQGYFEWKKEGNEKTPYFVYLKSSPLIFFAGLYAHNFHYNDTEIVEGEYFSSFAIMTGPASGKDSNDMTWLHTRKPIMLKPNTPEWFGWLDPSKPLEEVFDCALNTDTNVAYDDIASYVVAKSIGNPTVEGPEAIKEVKKVQKSIGHFFLPKKRKIEQDNKEMTGLKTEEMTEIKTGADKAEVKKEDQQRSPIKGKSDTDTKKNSKVHVKKEDETGILKLSSSLCDLEPISKRVRLQHQGSENMINYANDDGSESESES